MEPDLKQLQELAIYLEGFYEGKGDLFPLGKIHLENLWATIRYLQNAMRL